MTEQRKRPTETPAGEIVEIDTQAIDGDKAAVYELESQGNGSHGNGFAAIPVHERFQSVLESIEDGYYETDLKGNVQFFNHRMASILGHSAEDLLGANYRQYTAPESVEEVYQTFNRVYQTGEPVKGFVWEFITQDGRRGFIETSTSLIRNAKGEPVGFRGIGRDVTERIRSEAKLGRTLAEMEQLYQASTRLNRANTPEEMLHDALLPSLVGTPSAITLYAVEEDDQGRPEWAEVLTHWSRATSGENANSAPGERLSIAGFPGVRQWAEEPSLPLLMGDVAITAFLDEAGRAAYMQNGTAAAAIIPLRLSTRWIGLITITWSERQVFTDSDARFYRSLAEQAAAQLHSHLLLAQVEKRAQALTTVTEVSTAVTTILDVETLLQMVVARTKESFDLYHAHIYLLDELGEYLLLRAGWGEPGRQMVAQGHAIPFFHEHSIVARTAREGVPTIVNDVAIEPDFLPNALLPDTRAEMAIPIIVGGLVLGVLDVQADRVHFFQESEVQVLMALASQLAVALHNARQFQETQQRTLELEETSSVLDKVLENLPVMLFMKEAEELRIVRWNKAAEEITGRPSYTLLGKNDGDLFPAEQAEFFNRIDREALERRVPIDVPQEPIDTVHQGRRILHTRKVPILDIHGNPRYLLGISEDITEQLEREQALAKQAAELDALNRRLTREGWQNYLQQSDTIGLHLAYEGTEGVTAEEPAVREVLHQPLNVRGEMVGELTLDSPQVLNEEAADIIEAVTERLAIHLENLRLTEQTEQALAESEKRARYQTNVAQAVATLTEEGTAGIPEVLRLLGEASQVSRVIYFDVYKNDDVVYWRYHAAWYDPAANLMRESLAPWELPMEARPEWLMALESGSPLTGFTSQMPPEVAHLLERFGIQSTLVLPVPSGDTAPGCITFDETRFEREWGEDEISALLTAASAIGNTVQRENLHQQIETSLDRTEALYRAGQAMLRYRDLDDLLRTVTDETVRALNADRVASLLFDEEAEQITHFVCAGPGREQITQPPYEALHSGLSGRVLQQGEAVLSPQEAEAEGGAMMIVPLTYRGQRFGTITATNRPEQRAFDQDDLSLLSAVARQAAVAIENLNLLTQTQQQLSDLSTLQQMAGRLATAVSLKEAISNVLPLLVTASNADFASLFRIEGQQGTRVGFYPPGAEETGFEVGETFPLSNYPQMLQVVRSKEALALPTDDTRLTEHARETFQSVGVTAVATVPIINRRGQVWGIFTLSARAQEFPFSPALMGLLKTMADQASIALERAESFQQTEQALAETEAMYAGSALVGQADSFQATLYALITATALRYLDYAHLMFFDEVWMDTPPTGMEVTAAWARQGEPPYFPVGQRLTAAELPFLKQMRRDIPTYLADVRTDTRLTARTRERLAEDLGMVTVAMFPLIAGGNCFGVLTAQAHRPHALSDTELRRIANLTDQASSVIQNLRLFAEARMHADELSILNDLAKALASELSVEDTIRNVYHYTGQLLEASDAYIALYDEAADEVDIKILGEGEIVVESALKRRGFNGITEYVLHTARPLLIHEDVPRVARELGVEVVGRPAQSWLGVPMLIGTRRLGMIAVQNFEQTHVFDEHDQELLTAVASQTAISLQNAYLLEQTQQALAEARTLYDVSAGLNAAITLEETLQAAIAPARENGATSAILWTYDYAGQAEPQWQEIVATWDAAGAPVELEQKRFRIADIPIAQLWHSTQNEPVFLPELVAGEPAVAEKPVPPAFQATMVMPLYTGRRQVGLITIRWPEARTFSAAEQRLYRSIASQTAEVVEGRLLLQAAQERTTQLELLTRIEADLSQVEDETDIVRAIAANFEDIPAAVLYYVDVDEANRPKHVRAVARWADHAAEALDGAPRLPAEEPLAPLWLSHPHDILMIEDTYADKRLTPEQTAVLDEMGARALTIAPFYSGGHWQGNMLLFWPQPFKFTETHRFVFRRLLEPVAAIITSRRAQLAQQAALDETERLYQAIAALNAAQTYEEILDVMRQYTDAGRLAKALSYGQFDRPWTDDDRPEWAYVKARWSQTPVPNALTRYRLTDIPAAEELKSGNPFVLEDIATDARLDDVSRKALYGPAMMRSAIFVPLLYAGRNTGYINVYFQEPRTFSEEEVRQLSAIASQAAIAIQSIRLLRDAQARVYREQVLRRVTAQVRSSTNIDTIMQTAVRELGQALGRKTFVALSDEQPESTISD